MKKISIVILHFKNKNLTLGCLNSIKELRIKDFILEVIIVDNSLKQDLLDLRNEFKEFVFLSTDENLGFSGGNNLGIKKALEDNADFVFIINNDTILDKNLLIDLLKGMGEDKNVGILGPKIYFASGCEFHKERYRPTEEGKVIWYAGGLIDWQNILASHRGVDEVDEGQYNQVSETDFVSGCAMFVKREVFEKIGLFDEKYFLYWEDIDFCQRAKKLGFKVVYTPFAKLWHANAGSSQVGGSLHDYYMTRNRLFFGMKYASLRTKQALLKEGLRLLFTGSKWQKIGIRDFYLKRFARGSYFNKDDKIKQYG